ncbi:bacteriocin formation protein, putative [Proteiniborus sp. DW1]|uniref:type 2 lanthipeptide synthetase LanM family protein n=1 Tax=Proteiniborus sp. DW1 TaxID=1889883 RepID=UPI00092E0516|nr:type 2 lanthipeptide synthetase LanM family protein [Proteiniborus sp. DW1]SCG83748.1 bacteriocin formation protein, putative [Proteiniborus sp. DW1]
MKLDNLVDSLTLEERKYYYSIIGKEPTKENYIKKWKQKKNLVSDDDFDIMLRTRGFSKEVFNECLSELSLKEAEKINEIVTKEEWVQLYYDILSNYQDIESIKSTDLLDIAYIVHPFILYYKKELNNIMSSIKKYKISEVVIQKIIQTYVEEIINIFSKVIIVDMNEFAVNFDFPSSEPSEKFIEYLVNRFNNIEEFNSFYSRYIVCTRLSIVRTSYSIDFIKESLNRLEQNFTRLVELGFINSNSNFLSDIRLSAGDSHDKGRSVIIFSFDHDKVVYKPRNHSITESFNLFIEWINEKSSLLEIKTYKGIYEEDYSFEEFVEQLPCESFSEIKQYYKRFGYILGLAHILSANDLHLENLIAHGEYPIIIDVETIIQSDRQYEVPESANSKVAYDYIFNSVQNTALLPTIAFMDKDRKGIDISALNGREIKLPYKILSLSNLNSIDMKYEYVEYVRPGSNNLPKLKNETVDFIEYREDILDGFCDFMHFIINNKNEILSDDGILNVFLNKKVRIVVKNTDSYGTLLKYSNHPVYCRDMLLREKLLENLWAFPHKERKISISENKDLIYGDIPIFYTLTNSLDLIDSHNNSIKNYFPISGFDKVKNRIKNLSVKDINRELSIIKVCLGLYDEKYNKGKKERVPLVNIVKENSNALMTEVLKIGDYILSKSYEARDQLSWPAINLSDNAWKVEAMDESLYSGQAGLALLFIELYKLTNEQRYKNAYDKIINSVVFNTKYNYNFAAYTGKLSLVFPVLSELNFQGHSQYTRYIDTAMNDLEENLNNIKNLDWIGGLAGILALTCETYKVTKNNRYLELIGQIADNLVVLQEMEREELKEGFAHGCVGIATSLLRAYQYIQNSVYKHKALELFDLQRERYGLSKEFKWCWGATGWGIALIDTEIYEFNSIYRRDLIQIIKNIPENLKGDDCICHGNLGDIEFLNLIKQLSLDIDINEINEKLNQRVSSILYYYNKNQKYNVNSLPEIPNLSLFTGLTGIAYQYIRLLSPQDTSNVYTLSI